MGHPAEMQGKGGGNKLQLLPPEKEIEQKLGPHRPGKRGQGRGESVNHQTSPRAQKGAQLAPHYQGDITDPETVTIENELSASECQSNAESAANTAAESPPKQETGGNKPAR